MQESPTITEAEVLALESRAHFAKPDALGSAAAYVDREYGCYGYSLAHVGGGHFIVRHFDGSRFAVHADQWGNVRRIDR